MRGPSHLICMACGAKVSQKARRYRITLIPPLVAVNQGHIEGYLCSEHGRSALRTFEANRKQNIATINAGISA